jgi:uncharacterized membrane protein
MHANDHGMIGEERQRMGMSNIDPAWGWTIVVGWLSILLVLALIIRAMVRCPEPRGPRASPKRSEEPIVQAILEQRYARGELSDEQFDAMRCHLTPPTSA